MERGVDVDLHLRAGLPNENFVGELLGNLAAFELARARGERLDWQVLRIEGEGPHHFRLVVRHPDRALDLGIRHQLAKILDELSQRSVEQLREQKDRDAQIGLRFVSLRHVHESEDFWQDDFWNWLG